jgi:DNA polymerase-3 subunit epsilon
VTRAARADGSSYLGPFRSSAAAHRAREAIEDAVPIRRCGTRIGRKAEIKCGPPCVPAQLGVSTCPCRGQVDDEEYTSLADAVRRGLRDEPALLCAPLEARMRRLADAERYEEAAATRDRLATLAQALQRQRAMDALRTADRLVLETDEGRLVLVYGRVVLDEAAAPPDPPDLAVPPSAGVADELMLVSRWLQQARRVRCEDATGVAASRLPAVASYARVRVD